jgi:hypothetical protein
MVRAAKPDEAEEFIRRGEEFFEREIRAKVAGEDPHRFLLIDVETGDFETDANEMAAFDRLHARRPDAQIYFRKVGTHISRRFGSTRDRRSVDD